MKPKPGERTTEFWLTILTCTGIVSAAIGEALPPQYAAVAASVSTAAYAISRGLSKLFADYEIE
jgi:hypothetical protein